MSAYAAMAVLLLHVIVSCLLITANCLRISVDPVNGINAGCQDGSHPCLNITTALNVRRNGVQYVLYRGTHYLDQSVSDFVNLSNIYIGNASAAVYIVCLSNSGLGFTNVSNATIQGTTFIGCGMVRNSATCDPRLFNHSATFCYLANIRAALYFYLSASVAFYNVTVLDSSNATGLVLYDTVGTNTIANCSFIRNGVFNTANLSSVILGGGGVHIEFSYCTPGSTCNINTPPQVASVSNSIYSIYHSYFGGNSAQTVVDTTTFIRPSGGYKSGLGCGGGLSVLFYGFSLNNTVNISDCVFQTNIGVVGGGLSVESRDYAIGNSFFLSNSVFVSNGNLFNSKNGGGLSIVSAGSASSNSINISQCVYVNNSALIGGAVSISTTLSPFQCPNYWFSDCTFQYNVAGKLGTVIAAFLQGPFGNGVAPVLKITGSCVVANNMLSVTDGSYDMGIGTIYTSGIPISFDGQITFEGNTGSALVSDVTYIDFCSCNATFISNQGVRGGAIALVSNSYISLCNSSILIFINNNASIDGGAIYNSYIQQTNAECFMRYSDPHLLPSEWKATFVFSGNTAKFGGNAIHSSSIFPCSVSSDSPQNTFCWNSQYWDYGGAVCTEQIASDAGSVAVNGSVKTFPGQIFRLPLVVKDDLQHNVLNETIFAAAIADSNRSVAGVSDGFAYVSNGYVQVYGSNIGNVTMKLDEVGLLGWHLDVNIEVLDCPPGLILVPSDDSTSGLNTCKCSQKINENYGSILLCSSDSFGNSKALLKRNHWMGYYPGTDTMVVGTCPPGHCNGPSSSPTQEQYIQLPLTVGELDDALCTAGRTGVLCGQCKPGYAVAVNSPTYECVQYDASKISGNVAQYFFLTLFSLIIVPISIILAGNYVTNGYANSIILYCQLIASTFDLTANGEIDMDYVFPNHGLNMVRSYKVFYGLFNLNGLLFIPPPFFLSTCLDVLGVIELKYLATGIPFLAAVTLYCCACCTTKCFVEKCKKNFSKNRHPVHIIAAFILLSFNNICITTTELLNTQSLIDSSGTRVGAFRSFYAGEHEWMKKYLPLYLIPVMLPILLLMFGCSHTCCIKWLYKNLPDEPCCSELREEYQSRCDCKWIPEGLCEPWSDAFYACYKPNMQWFAAAYFFVRIVVCSAYILAEPAGFIFTVQQITCIITIMVIVIYRPYKEEILNIWDAFLLSYLIVLSTLSQYNLEVYAISYQQIWIKIVWAVEFALLFFPFVLWCILMLCKVEQVCRLGYFPCKALIKCEEKCTKKPQS